MEIKTAEEILGSPDDCLNGKTDVYCKRNCLKAINKMHDQMRYLVNEKEKERDWFKEQFDMCKEVLQSTRAELEVVKNENEKEELKQVVFYENRIAELKSQADKTAIDFAKWAWGNYEFYKYIDGSNKKLWMRDDDEKEYTTEELYELFTQHNK